MSDFRPLLKRVSRSFYLSLRLLPPAVRPALSLAYLLARASDSIADAAGAPAGLRGEILSRLPERTTPPVAELGALPDGEAELLRSLPALFDELEASPDREEILNVWRKILSGQLFDLQRFTPGATPLTLAEASHYTGLVAGCVGTFWTQLCMKRTRGYTDSGPEAMCKLGFDFGCGLQWVNILRDRHADAAGGRIYVTEENFSAAMDLAVACLNSGAQYTAQVRPRRLRAACALPLALGRRTLDLVRANPQDRQIKTGRAFVWISLARALWH